MRRLVVTWLWAVALVAVEPRAAVRNLDSIRITVSDLDRAEEFYTKVLTFRKVGEYETHGTELEHLEGVFGARVRTARLRLGEEEIELSEYLAPQGRPLPVDARSNDRSFQHIAIIVSDMEKAYARLRQFKVRHASTGPQRLPDWNRNAGGIEAFYFKDPDGHALEILAFPEGKGAAKWHRPTQELFLGIDHTAIVVEDTGRSLRFYRDTLGMEVAGASENYGVEQEHLNNVFGARLRITALRAASGPGVEFLEYLAPADGRPYPAGTQANDLWHWQTRFPAASAEETCSRLRTSGARFVSSGTVTFPDNRTGFRKSCIVRDPDGHAVQIVE